MIVIPLGAGQLPPPSIRFIVPPDSEPAPLVFVGNAGEPVSVLVEPISSADATAASPVFVGFIENTAGLSNSRSIWNDVKAKAASGALDLSQYDLAFTIKLVDTAGETIASAEATPENPRVRLDAALPADGWYGVIAEKTDGSAGYAWVRLDGVQTFTTQSGDEAERIERYGLIPDTICPVGVRCRQVAERDLRFEGSRNLATYLSVQLVPFLNAVILPVIVGALIALGGSWLGYEVKRRNSVVKKTVSRWVVLAWVALLPVSWFVLRGIEGAATLPVVPTATWGGLLLTLVLTAVAIVLSFPLGVLLALGRWSNLSVVSGACTLFIEVVRGVPLITILFFAKLVVPFFLSASADVDQVIRMMIGLTLFTAAYIAEIVRGGLQIVPHGQIEAAHALGLNALYTTRLIVLPQALRAVIPAIMSQFVSLFKDTTLVSVVGLFELLGIIDFIVNGQQQYRGLQREAYLFVGVIYFVISFGMSTVSRWIEATGVGAARR
ncbi:MAG: amino acid ABC transporter permease [Chloroflexi bacterium]|nr:amino acid ABC transporter permease [Chloroflexota bacterium]